MSDVICIDGTYPSEYLAFYAKHGVVTPELDRIDQIREIVKHTDGSVGVRLVGLINPKVPIEHPIIGVTMIEPSFSIHRFRNLLGGFLNAREEEAELAGKIELIDVNKK